MRREVSHEQHFLRTFFQGRPGHRRLRGIGRAIALRLARDGFAVVVNYARSETAAREVVDAIEADGGRALAVPADVGDEQDVARLFDTAEQTLGGVRVVVNSAGELPMAPIETGRLADFDRVIRTNLRGTFLVLAEAAARLGRAAASSPCPPA